MSLKTTEKTATPRISSTITYGMELRDYQIEHVEDVLNDFKRHKSVILQMPTGTGKTNVFCEIARRFCRDEATRRKRTLILAHRIELLQQIKDRLVQFGFNAGIIQGRRDVDENFQIQIASVQTLDRRDKFQFMSRLSLIIIDEAHHTPSATYKRIIEAYQPEDTRLLGVTATPIRLDGKGFDQIFDKLIPSQPFKWFIANNYLSAIKHYASASIRLSNIPVVRDNFGYEDYDLEEVENYYTSGEVMADVLKSYKDYGQNKKSIVFAASIFHALEVEKRFIAEGYRASVISSLTNESDRKERIEDFRKGRIRILVNVDIFSEGFDCPDVEVVQMLKPTKSLVKYLQMAGRVTRIFAGKEYGIILDNARLWADHGLITHDRRWTLKGCVTLGKDFDELNFTNGESGEDAYKKHINEHVDVGMVEVDSTGTTPDIIFLNKRLVNVKNEFKVTWNELFDYFESIDLDLTKHCQGPSNSIYQRKVSQELYVMVDKKFCSHKSFYKALRSID